MSDETRKTMDQMTVEELAADIERQQKEAEVAPTEPQTPPAPESAAPPAMEEVSFTAIDGTVYKAATTEKLWEIVQAALNNTKVAYREAKREAEALKPKPVEPETFNNEKYYDMLVKDPIQAQDYMDSFRETPRKAQELLAETEQRRKREEAVRKFYDEVPEYRAVDTPEISAAFRSRMTERGREVTADNLKLTYLELRQEGKIADAPVEASRPKAPPRSPDSSSRRPAKDAVDIQKMTAVQLREFIEKQIAEKGQGLQ